MQFNGKITRENAFEIIKEFAKEYRHELGKVPGEIIIVGGGSIMLNYKFREATQDFDVIFETTLGISDVISKFADDNALPRDWMNSDFVKTASYSKALSEVSKHFCSLNNNTLEIRTVAGKYLIAMKLRSHREYRNDLSDIIGILVEERELGNAYTSKDIFDAYLKLYDETLSDELKKYIEKICSSETIALKELYVKYNENETHMGDKIIKYIDDGADIKADNVDDIVTKIKAKLKK